MERKQSNQKAQSHDSHTSMADQRVLAHVKSVVKWKFIDGRKQKPKDLDFHITPVITFSRAGEEVADLGTAWGIFIEWGYWAFGFGVFSAYVR